MRTSSLQDLYLQRPVTLTILVCILSVLPWIAMNDFATKGEPREAAVAISMLETGNFILPTTYADEFAYKPPMAHWLMALCSLPQGYVSEFTSRLPSAIAFTCMIGFLLGFFGKRREKSQEVFLTIAILITCIEIHRGAMTTRVDMLLTTFMVIGLIQLFRWEEMQQLKGLPVAIPILLGCAMLTKGPVGIVLPLFIFFVYLLMLNKYRFLTVIKAMVYIGISSLFLPLLWYVAAWRQGGDDFLNVVLAENFGRFFHLNTPNINYELGHENGAWYNIVTLLAGFVPWTILAFFALFGMKIRFPRKSLMQICLDAWKKIRSMDKISLFSLVALVCVVFFYSIPSSKRSVYLMPAYPFIALFLAQFMLYLTEYRTRVTRVFAHFMAALTAVVTLVLLLTTCRMIDPLEIVSSFTQKDSTLATTEAITQLLVHPSFITILILLALIASLIIVYYQLSRKINIKILYATFGLMFCINLLIDGVIMKAEKGSGSAKPFARQIMHDYPLQKDNVYVMNNLLEYRNLYGLNFYMGNLFHNFENDQPQTGFFLSAEPDMEKVLEKYAGQYRFQLLTTSPNVIKDVRRKVVLYSFERMAGATP